MAETRITTNPLVSVILPVYNAEKYLAESIRSVLNQTFTDFELIILNDGSTDESSSVINTFADSRIRYVEHSNMGLAKTLNKGISLAKGKYIARQDNDDISYPDRLKLEVNFLEKHPDYALVGAQARIINEQGIDTGRKHLHATKSPQLCFDLVFDNPFVHSSVLFNKQMLFNVGGYDANHNFFEDHNLWSRISRTNKIANLPNVLLDYREVGTGMSKSEKKYSDQVRNQTKLNLSYYFSFSENEINHLAEIYHSGYKTKKEKQLLKSLGKNLIELIFTSENENEKKLVFQRFLLKMEMQKIRNDFSQTKLSALSLFVLKLKRRWIFHRFNQLNSSHQF